MESLPHIGIWPSYETLAAENVQLRQQVADLEGQVVQLEAEVADLRAQLEEARREQKRKVAPFSKGAPKEHPKRPGRKSGHRPTHRPIPEQVDRTEDVPLPFHICPDCGGRIEEVEVHPQYQTDVPPIRPVTTRFDIHVGQCQGCGRRVQGRHPDQTSDALGGASVQIGPNALATASEMHHGLGVSYGKLATFFESVLSLRVCASTFARADARLAYLLEPTYRQLILSIRQSQVVYADETSWRISGKTAWLWVFTQVEVTVYVIDARRSHQVAEQILGEDFDGVMVSDCFSAYDPLDYDKQKCLGHLLHSASQIEESKTRGAVRFPRAVMKLLRAGIALKKRKSTMSPHGYAVACGRIEAATDRLLAGHFTDPDNKRLANRLRKHRPHLLTFLYNDAVEATNNAAERALRPAVISRKLSAGNRSPKGGRTHAVLASVIQTCRQKGQSFQALIKKLLCAPKPHMPDWAVPPQQPP